MNKDKITKSLSTSNSSTSLKTSQTMSSNPVDQSKGSKGVTTPKSSQQIPSAPLKKSSLLSSQNLAQDKQTPKSTPKTAGSGTLNSPSSKTQTPKSFTSTIANATPMSSFTPLNYKNVIKTDKPNTPRILKKKQVDNQVNSGDGANVSSKSGNASTFAPTNYFTDRLLMIKPRVEGLSLSNLKTKKYIASGQYSRIYLVVDENYLVTEGKIDPNNPNNFYALKEIQKSVIKENKLTSRVQSEIEIMYKQQNHDNIVKLYSHFEDSFTIYLVTEYVDGWNLKQLSYIQSIESELKFSIIQQIGKGIQYLHSNSIIHRDLKPDNILINSKNQVKISDFGWSNYFPQANRKRITRVQTPQNKFSPYVSPDITSMMGHSEKVDIWCYGVLIYFILSDGNHPFGIPENYQNSDPSVISSIETNMRQNIFLFDQNLNRLFPHALDLLASMLNKDQNARPSIEVVLNHPFFTKCIANEINQNKVGTPSKQLNKQNSDNVFQDRDQNKNELNKQNNLNSNMLQRLKEENNQDVRMSIANNEKKNMMRITLTDLVKVMTTQQSTGSLDGRGSATRVSLAGNSTGNDANEIRKTIKKETENYTAIDQINQLIFNQEKELNGGVGGTNQFDNIFQSTNNERNSVMRDNQRISLSGQSQYANLDPLMNRLSYQKQKEYLETDFQTDLAKKLDDQIQAMMEQERQQQEDESRKQDEMKNALDSLTSIMADLLKNDEMLVEQEQVTYQNKLQVLKEEENEEDEDGYGEQPYKYAGHNLLESDQQGDRISKEQQQTAITSQDRDSTGGQIDFDQFEQFNPNQITTNQNKMQKQAKLEPIMESNTEQLDQSNNFNSSLQSKIEESSVVPLQGVEDSTFQYQQDIEESNVVPLTGIEESSVIPFQGKEEDSQQIDSQDSNQLPLQNLKKQGSKIYLKKNSSEVIKKVFSSIFGEEIVKTDDRESLGIKFRGSNLDEDFLIKNANLLLNLNNKQSVSVLDNTSSEKENGQTTNIAKEVFKQNKAFLNSLKDTVADANNVLEDRLKILKTDRDQLVESIKESQNDIDRLKTYYLRNKDYRFNEIECPLSLKTFMTLSDIEKCNNLEYLKYESSQVISDLTAQKEEKCFLLAKQKEQVQTIGQKWEEIQQIVSEQNEKKELIAEQEKSILDMNSKILLLKKLVQKYQMYQDLERLKDSIVTSRDSFHGGTNDLQFEEAELKEVLQKISSLNKLPVIQQAITQYPPLKDRIRELDQKEYQLLQEKISLSSSIDETVKQEYEKKKEEISQIYLQQKKQQDEYYQEKIANLEEKIIDLKVTYVPYQEFENQRSIKKHLDTEIQTLEAWIERNSKPQKKR